LEQFSIALSSWHYRRCSSIILLSSSRFIASGLFQRIHPKTIAMIDSIERGYSPGIQSGHETIRGFMALEGRPLLDGRTSIGSTVLAIVLLGIVNTRRNLDHSRQVKVKHPVSLSTLLERQIVASSHSLARVRMRISGDKAAAVAQKLKRSIGHSDAKEPSQKVLNTLCRPAPNLPSASGRLSRSVHRVKNSERREFNGVVRRIRMARIGGPCDP
jgi:hypothetical protein